MPWNLDTQSAGHVKADRQALAESAELSMRERGERLMAACRAASLIYQSRIAAGLPPEQPEPWPASTWEFLKEKARLVREVEEAR